jgi:integrase/recombinase XerD
MKAMPSLILSVEKELPVHHKLEELLDHYLKASGLEKEPGSPLFPASIGKTAKLSRRPLARTDAADMLKRRLNQAGLPAHYSPHSFRATGITNFLEDDGTLEAAQRIAGHADSRTTKLYDRRGQSKTKTIEEPGVRTRRALKRLTLGYSWDP